MGLSDLPASITSKIRFNLDTGCWEWTAARSTSRYALGRWNGKKCSSMHRVLYEHFKGPIPEGLEIDHRCRVRHCVNPAHLEAVTKSVNVQRAWDARPEASHCKHGHELTEENSYIWQGSKHCRRCRADASARYEASARTV